MIQIVELLSDLIRLNLTDPTEAKTNFIGKKKIELVLLFLPTFSSSYFISLGFNLIEMELCETKIDLNTNNLLIHQILTFLSNISGKKLF